MCGKKMEEISPHEFKCMNKECNPKGRLRWSIETRRRGHARSSFLGLVLTVAVAFAFNFMTSDPIVKLITLVVPTAAILAVRKGDWTANKVLALFAFSLPIAYKVLEFMRVQGIDYLKFNTGVNVDLFLVMAWFAYQLFYNGGFH